MSGDQEPDEKPTIHFADDGIIMPRWVSVFAIYGNWQNGHLPRAGGYLDQPLGLMKKLEAIRLVSMTYRDVIDGNKWEKMTADQLELNAWIKAHGDD